MRYLCVWLVFASVGAYAEDGKKQTRVVVNKAKDIFLVAEADTTVRDFFQTHPMLVGYVLPDQFNSLMQADKVTDKVFLNYASYNDDPEKGSLFGASISIAPFSPDVRELLKNRKDNAERQKTLLLRRDATVPTLFHVVGYTTRTSVGFFDNKQKNDTDGFSQTELRFQPPPKK